MLFFVQRMDELLFYYSMDTYKTPTLGRDEIEKLFAFIALEVYDDKKKELYYVRESSKR